MAGYPWTVVVDRRHERKTRVEGGDTADIPAAEHCVNQLIGASAELTSPTERNIVVLRENQLVMRHEAAIAVTEGAVVEEGVLFITAIAISFDILIRVVALERVSGGRVHFEQLWKELYWLFAQLQKSLTAVVQP